MVAAGGHQHDHHGRERVPRPHREQHQHEVRCFILLPPVQLPTAQGSWLHCSMYAAAVHAQQSHEGQMLHACQCASFAILSAVVDAMGDVTHCVTDMTTTQVPDAAERAERRVRLPGGQPVREERVRRGCARQPQRGAGPGRQAGRLHPHQARAYTCSLISLFASHLLHALLRHFPMHPHTLLMVFGWCAPCGSGTCMCDGSV